ncbi:MAG: Hsp20 family protein, partial [Theionarchaea archaeon]|nr:Hsp20 family protein [Theionarchaea archaeon]
KAIPLPAPVRSDEAKTTYKNGVLDVTLPKKEQSPASEDTVED